MFKLSCAILNFNMQFVMDVDSKKSLDIASSQFWTFNASLLAFKIRSLELQGCTGSHLIYSALA